ncbi:Flagellar basal-body rod protein FlgF (plasmid) [Rhodovastum atsumiense]|uniref:flagellar basal-body rod protein FlgF n=1 Tax=Rhodovastum atsumiense TaxID=504468 RepID=UPI002024CAFF|nr:flagellar basal-body rod protein FlgF [Rhodovastum atsumiense]CAH2605446.1 Flagellar basal-body rod protein FlgF [Rhodovastum atsumiense]
MEGPTYVSLSAQVALQHQLEVVANNVANANSTGFKADRQLFQTYVNRLAVPGGQVAFVQDRATYIDRTAGPIQTTGNPLDVAIQGDGLLAVTTPQGIRYTRDGRLHLRGDNTLVDAEGRPLQGEDGQPITLPENFRDIVIRGDGSIRVVVQGAVQEVGRLASYRATDPLTLRKDGNGLLIGPVPGMTRIEAADNTSRLVQGSLEGSTVQPVVEIANMTELSRAYDRLQTLVSDDNDRERKMIDRLGNAL